ncbi:hypothetical protein [Desulforamulus ruminis]|uniref:Uncharacterized protein n=1 Tax=Desulforamulus ruminis (strain ATCC 23193 / DSM 2154 / NCIMB 8452 / DL) TaxID=696281 RepID=F6DMR1_DESRL|nr:hypothetical protein [Desulforamulus ruminis]AEG58469.1 hypothetical protein Desru_0170 [Desulforamulus ruminis DSM 2154]
MKDSQDANYLKNNGLEVTDMQEGKVFWVKFPTGYRIIMDADELNRLAKFFELHKDKGPGVIEMLFRSSTA